MKTPEQIAAQRAGGKKLAQILQAVREFTAPGRTGLEINDFTHTKIKQQGAEAAYAKEAPDFPGVICISKNNAILHGVPDAEPLLVGDKVSFDLTISYQGMDVDAAFTMIVGRGPNALEKHLLISTEQAFWAGVKGLQAGQTTGDIGSRVERVLKKANLGIITDFVGHGIGATMHEAPEVPNYGRPGTGERLVAGQTICIEPMASLASPKIKIAADGWTVLLNNLGCHYEHTVLLLETGCEVLTTL